MSVLCLCNGDFRCSRGNRRSSGAAAWGMAVFRPAFDALTAMGFYNLNPKLTRELQKPQEGRLLKSLGKTSRA